MLKCDIKMYEAHGNKRKRSKFSFSVGRDTQEIIIEINSFSVALAAYIILLQEIIIFEKLECVL